MTSIAHRFAAAFATRDPGRVTALFAADATYDDLFYGRFRGRDGLTGLFRRMYAEGDRHAWEMTHVVADAGRTVAEWTFTFTVSAAVPSGAGRTLRYRGVSVFETGPDGRCHAYREHFDRAAVLHALGADPAVVARLVARRPGVEVLAAEPRAGTLSP